MSIITPIRHVLRGMAVFVLAGILAIPSAAHAFWRGGVFIGVPPVVVGPPAYYVPPVYYAPPVTYVPAARGRSCYAGAYVCPMAVVRPVGEGCSCPAEGGRRVFGTIG